MKKGLIMTVLLAAAIGAHAGEHDPYTARTSGEWMETVNDQASYDPATLYHGNGWIAVWANIKEQPRVSHGYLLDEETDRIEIICKSHVYAVSSVSLYRHGDFLVRHDYSEPEIAQSITRYADSSPVGAIALQVCGSKNAQW